MAELGDSMNDRRRVNRWIVCHFIWTVAIATAFLRVGEMPFRMVLLINAGSAVAVATARRESLRLRRLTLWDEAVGFVGVSAAAGLLQ